MPTFIQVTPQPGSGFRVGPWVLRLTIILGPQPSLSKAWDQHKDCYSALSSAGTYSLESAQPHPGLKVALRLTWN